MRLLRFICVSLGVLGWLGGPGVTPALAQANAQAVQQQIDQLRRDFDALKQQYGDRLTALEASWRRFKAGRGARQRRRRPPRCRRAPRARADRAALCRSTATRRGASKVFNPDMAVIGDFLGAMGRNPVVPQPSLQMHESEASFQAIVDPYARADFFISFGEEGVELEEGYVTFTSLPAGLLGKVGQDARGVRQGEHLAQSRAARGPIGRSSRTISWAAKRASAARASRLRG